jgi:hypothetical protein
MMLAQVITFVEAVQPPGCLLLNPDQTWMSRSGCWRYINDVLRVHRGRQVDAKVQAAVTNLESAVDIILCHTTRHPDARVLPVPSFRILVLHDVQRPTVMVFEKRHPLVRCGCCFLHQRCASLPTQCEHVCPTWSGTDARRRCGEAGKFFYRYVLMSYCVPTLSGLELINATG